MTKVVKRKFFFLITGSDLLFNKLDEIEHEFISLIISERNGFNVIAISSVIPVLSLKWLYMASSDCL